jgi:hypothetical protein
VVERAVGKIITDANLQDGKAVAIDYHEGLSVEIKGLGLHGPGQQELSRSLGIPAAGMNYGL